MIPRPGAIAAIAWIASCGYFAGAQALSWTTLKIDLQNAVEYQADIADPSQFATKATGKAGNSTARDVPPRPARNLPRPCGTRKRYPAIAPPPWFSIPWASTKKTAATTVWNLLYPVHQLPR